MTIVREPAELLNDGNYNKYLEQFPYIDSAQKIGLSETDFISAVKNKHSVVVECKTDAGEMLRIPIIVPTSELSWYNTSFLRRKYGSDRDIYYMPPLPMNIVDTNEAGASVSKFISNGGVVLVDVHRDYSQVRLEQIDQLLSNGGIQVSTIENPNSDEESCFLNQYIAEVNFGDNSVFRNAPTFIEQYQTMIASGELPPSNTDGVQLVDTIDGEEADRIWRIYQEPFDKISENHPINSGYNHEKLLAILRDPSVVKVVNKSEGEITTLCFFLTDIKQCGWLNKEYYKNHLSEAIDTDNLLLFLGIVTDEEKRGNAYSSDVVNLLTQVANARRSSVILSFECNDITYKITPPIVKAGIEQNGLCTVSGLEQPVSQTRFYEIQSVSV